MGYTLYSKQLTPELKNIILDFVLTNNANPTGIWRDFHCVHRSWRNLEEFAQARLLSEDDLPEEPDARDYPNTESAATLQCPETCCIDCSKIYGCNCVFCSREDVVDPSTLNLTSSFSSLSQDGWTILTEDDWSNLSI